jgi:septal ring factor EnvC (AmiA/AmiB activator)
VTGARIFLIVALAFFAAPALAQNADTDMSRAVPADQANKLPTTEQQYRALKQKVEQQKPGVASAKSKSEALKEEAEDLRQRLIGTANRVQNLEEEKGKLDLEIAALSSREKDMAASFSHDRVKVARLLAILERLQHDMPPVIAYRPADALASARGAMLLGASLPRVYGEAAALARRLDNLRKTRKQLIARRAQGVKNANALARARLDLDQLLAMKEEQAEAASADYGKLQGALDTIAGQADDLGQLLAKVAALRAAPSRQNIVVVAAAGEEKTQGLSRGALSRPVVGRVEKGALGGGAAPGVSFLTSSGAQVVAPADGRVLFAGRYHKTGQVLILEMAGGYDLVLAGLGRVDVRSGDQLLAGEPVGTMPQTGGGKLYFELRHNGKGESPAPWLQVDLRKAKG